ncbi:hypothetical protein ACLOJK_000585 [Asimina triloba]
MKLINSYKFTVLSASCKCDVALEISMNLHCSIGILGDKHGSCGHSLPVAVFDWLAVMLHFSGPYPSKHRS